MNKLIKPLIVSIAIIGLHLFSIANPVDLQTAQSVASKFIGTYNLQLAATYTTDKNIPAFYVFNTPKGFVIVSADDCETPIVGYSYEGRFDPNNVPVQMEDYLQDFVARIQYGIENHIAADEVTARQWELVNTTGRLNESKSAKAVEPLLTEMWEQGCLYNSLCPEMGKAPCGHAETGCVAVAMGQIMHYWRSPGTGWGSHSYYNLGVQLSADFGNTVYDWDHMPDSLTEDSSEAEIEAVATLLYHCGISVDMSYTANGSGADSEIVPDALTNYFKYSRCIHIEKQKNYDNEEWMALLKSNLDLRHPVYYSGGGDQGRHAFVCDGYDNNDLLHFNWGWGRANGYFALGNLNPIGYSFNTSCFAIFDIVPNLTLYQVSATIFPPSSGHIEGIGGYHIHEDCTLTAVPEDDYEFYHWRKNGAFVSFDTTYSMHVVDDINDIEAYFVLRPITSINACLEDDSGSFNNPIVSFSYEKGNGMAWPLMKRIEIDNGAGAISDGEFIYVFYNWNSAGYKFSKYTLDGEFIENFNVNFNVPGGDYLTGITYDGTYFYGIGQNQRTFYTLDLKSQQLINTSTLPIHASSMASPIVYDSIRDAFWIAGTTNTISAQTFFLINRECQIIKIGPSTPFSVHSAGLIDGSDHNRHLLASNYNGWLYDYNIDRDVMDTLNIVDIGHGSSHSIISIGQYEGKDAVFVCNKYNRPPTVKIYEIGDVFTKVMYYRIYRSDSLGNIVMLADEFTKSQFVDTTWNSISPGSYRYGASSVFFEGTESDIIWSDTIVKTGHGINENESGQEDAEPSIQKVIEDGHIVIIKDGKRYNVLGQKMN